MKDPLKILDFSRYLIEESTVEKISYDEQASSDIGLVKTIFKYNMF